MRITAADKWRIYELYYLPPRASASELARRYGTTPGRIRRIVDEVKQLRLNDYFYRAEDRQKDKLSRFRAGICREYASGMPVADIARRHRMTRGAVHSIVKKGREGDRRDD